MRLFINFLDYLRLHLLILKQAGSRMELIKNDMKSDNLKWERDDRL